MKLDVNGSHTLYDLLTGWSEHRRTFELPRAAEHDQEAFRWLFETLDNLVHHANTCKEAAGVRTLPSEPAPPTKTGRCRRLVNCAAGCGYAEHGENAWAVDHRVECGNPLPCPAHPEAPRTEEPR